MESVVLVVIGNHIDPDCLESINNQSYTNLKLVFLSDFHMVKFKDFVSFLLSDIEFDFIIFYTSNVISYKDRVLNQVDYMLDSPLDGIVSCLEEGETYRNSLISKASIDTALKGGFLAINLGSLLIRRDVLCRLTKISSLDFSCDDELKILFELLLVSSVSKLPSVLINSLVGFSFNDYNKVLGEYNAKSFIQKRTYFNELLASPTLTPINSTPSTNLLMLVDGFDIGGTETHIFNLISNLVKLGYGVFLGCFSGSSLLLLEHNSIPYIVLSEDNYFKELELFIASNNISFIHCHLERSIKLSYYLNLKNGTPYVVTIHGSFYSRECIYKHCSRAFLTIFVSLALVDFYLDEAKGLSNFKVIPNGINFPHGVLINKRASLNIPSSDFVVTYCSRLDKIKGEIALSVMSKLINVLQNNNNVTLLIMGDGFSFNRIERYANQINFALKRVAVVLSGCVFDTLSYFYSSDVVIGTGRVILEAMSISKPVICYGLAGLIGAPCEDNYEVLIHSNFGDHGDYVFYCEESLEEIVLSKKEALYCLKG
ncbi:MAG: glycosyltransferase [Clostridium sp.]